MIDIDKAVDTELALIDDRIDEWLALVKQPGHRIENDAPRAVVHRSIQSFNSYAAGRITASSTWMTPFVHSMSVVTTFAEPFNCTPSVTVTEMSAPFTVFTF